VHRHRAVAQEVTRRDGVGVAVLVAGAVAFALGVLQRRTGDTQSLVAYDFYGQFYPYLVHAGRSLRAGGGLLWNPYQDCGQPFFGNSQTGLLYPLNVIFAALPREPALLVSVVVHLTIAGVGMYLLCRSLRLARPAALCGALAFQLGWAATNLAAWSPTHVAPYAWLPVALWQTERVIRRPTLRGGLVLGLILAIQLLPGFPQTVFFTYQLIALRVVWAVLLRQSDDIRTMLIAVAVGLVVPVLLDAVQLLPAMEVARESVRQGPVSAELLGPGFSWQALRQGLMAQVSPPGSALMLLLAVSGVVAVRRPGRAADVAFYVLVALLYFVLSLGPGSIVYALYERLPLGDMFRAPARLLWVTSFALSVLVAFGSQAFVAAAQADELNAGVESARPDRSRGWRIAVGLLAGAVMLYAATAGSLAWTDLLMVGVLAGLALAVTRPQLVRLVPLALPALILVDTLVVGRPPLFGLRKGDVYDTHADVFDFIRARLTPQDRLIIVGAQPALGLMPKSATLFALPSIHDYDSLAAQRYAEYFTFLRTGRAMRDYEDWYWLFGKLLPASLRRPLFDQTAARYVIVAEPLDKTARALRGGLRLLHERDGVRVYENEQALPRARYVPRVAVKNEAEVLPALASRAWDGRRVAIVAAGDAAALRGSGGDGSGTVEFVADEPERVVLRATATAPGFLLLADEFFPGWTVTVNGVTRPVVRANHTFRLVEVPAGESEVVFIFRPLSLRIGAAVSLLGAIVFVLLWRWGGALRPRSLGGPSAQAALRDAR
jgi:hypothetical protein